MDFARTLFFDGGMGTMIQKNCTIKFEIPEDLNFTNSELIKNIHTEYLKAGVNVITTNSFGANPVKIGDIDKAKSIVKKSIQIAKNAISEYESTSGKNTEHFVAWDLSQNGKLMEPMGSLTFDQAYESYKEIAIAAEEAGADFALVETMADLYEIKAAVFAIKENTKLPVVASVTFQENLRTLSGADVLTCVTYIESMGVDALGFNCGGGLEDDRKLADDFLRYSHLPVLVQPNAGIPAVENGKTVFKLSPDEFARFQLQTKNNGALLLGGCCGTTPEHISKMIQLINQEAQEPVQTLEFTLDNKFSNTYICSYNKTVKVGGQTGPVIIGERINPTGKKKCREALIAGDMNFVINEAENQIASGAHILDVNVGVPGISEKDTMLKAVKTLQKTFNTPLQIDSGDVPTLETVLRYYNGKALVNSVNGKEESMNNILPLVKKYGASVVALCLDENGIAPTAEGRVQIAEKIINRCASLGIPMRDIFVDTLTMTVSSDQTAAMETVRAIQILKSKYESQGLRFILGVSNISFGLPRRDIINSRFLEIALYAGLDACIINPMSDSMTESFNAYRTLMGYDKNCLDYIQKYTGTLAPCANSAPVNNAPVSSNSTQEKNNGPDLSTPVGKLIAAIEKGFKDNAASLTAELLKTHQPVEIIDSCIVPALDNVGKDFETGKKFLPQLLSSADTVSEAFKEIKTHLQKMGKKEESKGTVILATVHGDIHDIGKNIVKALLENYGFTVIDLGKNVEVQTVVDTVVKNQIKLVGLSALMTTTVGAMEDTIREIRRAVGDKCKICVGGAVLNQDYAHKIGADFYAKDAMKTVNFAKEIFK